MNHRERMLATLRCQPADRAPFPMWLGFSPWWETLLRWRQESGHADLDHHRLVERFGFEPFFQCVPAEAGPWPHFPARTVEEDAEFVVAVDWRGITTRNRRDGHSMPEFLAHPVRNRADWERYRDERLQPCLEERLRHLPAFAAAAPAAGVAVQAGGFPWGVFGTARDLLGAEELLLAFYTDPELVHDIMATCTTLWLQLWTEAARQVHIDHIHIWEDMSGRQGSLISMAMVEAFMMPHYDRIATFAREHGVDILSVDSDGLVDELVPTMVRHGVNAYFPFEVQAGNDVEAVRRRFPTLGILGGLDKNALALGRPEMHRELDRAERMLAGGGYVPGFDHALPPNVPWANFAYFTDHLRRLVGA